VKLVLLAVALAAAKLAWVPQNSQSARHHFLVQIPRHPVKLDGKPAALYVNCSTRERVIALYGGDEPESLLTHARAVLSAPAESCEVRWAGGSDTWLYDKGHRLLVARDGAGMYGRIMALPSWGPSCKRLHLDDAGDAFAPSHIEEGSTIMADSSDTTDSVYVEDLPEAVMKVQPAYPTFARQKRIEGLVYVQAKIDTTGGVERHFVVQSIPDLDAAALDAVQQWKFRPAATAGHPIAVWVMVPVRFRLN
jgi:TonB family protein